MAAAASAPPLWLRSVERASLWSTPSEDADRFGTADEGAYFRLLEAQDQRYRVYFGGDRVRQRPGEVWIDKASVAQTDWPQFVKTRAALVLTDEPRSTGRAVARVRGGGYLEILQAGPGDWARVLYLGDGRDGGPQVGWAPAASLVPSDVDPARIGRFVATANALRRPPDVWLKVPYRSQLDGMPWALANCGPTTVSMILEAHGIDAASADVRREVMALQRTQNCNDCGSFIESLAGATEQFGLKPLDLLGGDGKLRRWSLDDIRAALRAGHPVLPQVMFRQLPGREDSPYWGDHYIVLTGTLGDNFLYNDPIDDGPGYGRLISGEQLRRAMAGSDFPYAAFASALP